MTHLEFLNPETISILILLNEYIYKSNFKLDINDPLNNFILEKL